MAQYHEGGGRMEANDLPKPLEPVKPPIRPPIMSDKDLGFFGETHPDETISKLHKSLTEKKITVDQAAETILDEVLPQSAVCPSPVRNIKTAADVLKNASEDEFTDEAVEILESADGENQDEFKAKLKSFALKRCVFNLFYSTSTKYQQINGNYLTFKDELNHGGGVLEHPFTKSWAGNQPDCHRIEQQRRTLNTLAVHWDAQREESSIQPHQLSTENPAFSWHELFIDDVLGYGLTMQIEGVPHKIKGGQQITERDLHFIEKGLDKTKRELAAAGLILAKDDVNRKWSYFDQATGSNYQNAINRLNNGDEADVGDAIAAVTQRFPKAMQKKEPD